jgi:ribose 5-phosphate isomerase RpiB
MRVAIGADHAGFTLKEDLKRVLRELGSEALRRDVGPCGR